MTIRAPASIRSLFPAVLLAGCAPLGGENAPCETGPCAPGLVCLEGVCKPPPESPPDTGCTEDEECIWKGSADGRACEDGVCVFASCTFDAQCGSRICDAGRCAEVEVCLDNGDCTSTQTCQEGVCRTPCTEDADCPVFGGFVQACVDGTCRQRCIGDFTCLGDICEDNLCVEPACFEDKDCGEDGNFFCGDGRCVEFTPCVVNEDCFDPDFACSDLGRCEERPLCRVDNDCGDGLCINRHCRDAQPCDDQSPCAASAECVAGRCVDAPGCRTPADCSAGATCDNGRCIEPALDDVLVVETWVLARAAFVGDTVELAAQAFGAEGLPARAAYRWSGASGTGARASVVCAAPGIVPISLDVEGAAGPHATLDLGQVSCVEPTGALSLLVLEGASGEPAPGVTVFAGDVAVGATDDNGSFAWPAFEGGDVGAQSPDGRGVVLMGAPAGRLYLALPAPMVTNDADVAAGVRVRVRGTGDEEGPVGLSLALPVVEDVRAATLDVLFGPPFVGGVTVPVLGALPVELPAAVMLDVTLPVAGLAEVKELAWLRAPAGPASLLAYEARFPQQTLFDIVLGADPVEVTLDLAAGAEGMDAALAGGGVLTALPLVQDGDLSDGVEDVDGDGDVAELVPDWAAFAETEVAPFSPPTERVGLRVSPPPLGANARMFVACGVETPGRFIPLGVGVAFGTSDTAAADQVKVVAAPSSLEGQPRACAVHAVAGAVGTRSVAVARADAFGPLTNVGSVLAAPTGSFILSDVPAPDRASLVVPTVVGADALAVDVVDVAGAPWTVMTRARGTVPLPAWLTPGALVQVRALRLGRTITETLGAGPLRALETEAEAIAVAP